MATPQPPRDSLPPSLSMLRRRLLSSEGDLPEPAIGADSRDESVDFESTAGNGLLQPELDEAGAGEGAHEDVEALLHRYEAEKTRPEPPEPALPPLSGVGLASRRGPGRSDARANGNFGTESTRGSGGRQLPSLVTPLSRGSAFPEFEKVRAENEELRAMVAELREFLETNDPELLVARVHELEQAVAQKDEHLATQKQQLDHWQEELKTHRFVPSDNEIAQMADEVEKERCQVSQERRQLEEERAQLREDEDSLMKQMREMEISMARDRAELARQRMELQRLHTEIKHELDVMQRGDASLKERLAQFQRRQQDVVTRSAAPAPRPTAPPPQATPLTDAPAKPRDSGVIKRLFGQGG